MRLMAKNAHFLFFVGVGFFLGVTQQFDASCLLLPSAVCLFCLLSSCTVGVSVKAEYKERRWAVEE